MAKEKIKRIIPYVAILLICVYLYLLALQWRVVARGGNLGPDFWPKLLLGLTMATCLYEIIRNVFSKQNQTAKGGDLKEEVQAKRQYPGLLVVGAVMTVAYVYFLPILGFALCTFLYLALFMPVGRYRNARVILSNSIIGAILFVFLFMKVVYVSLPIGEGPFQKLSLILFNLLGIK